jgi:large subunit ribosomal protein L23
MLANKIILAPVVTEKTMKENSFKKYVFKVSRTAGKIQIKKAVEQIFEVKVAKVNTVNVRGKLRRQRGHQGYTSSWKKAVVKLEKSSKTIDFFDGMT